jgi:DNA-binding transcriptional regulator YiaG
LTNESAALRLNADMTSTELKAMRKAAKISQRELGRRLGRHAQSVTHWEIGRYPIDGPTEIAIRAVLSAAVEARERPSPVQAETSESA